MLLPLKELQRAILKSGKHLSWLIEMELKTVVSEKFDSESREVMDF